MYIFRGLSFERVKKVRGQTENSSSRGSQEQISRVFNPTLYPDAQTATRTRFKGNICMHEDSYMVRKAQQSEM